MDEPTSGLDSRAAAIVMRTVRNTVDTGRTVVCTIRQPSIDIFEAFDELSLMKRGGEEIYVGSLGSNSCQLIKCFEDVEGVNTNKDGYNSATWMLEVATQEQEGVLGVNFAKANKNSVKSGHTTRLVKLFGFNVCSFLFIGIQNGQTVQPIVNVERTVFNREKAAGVYSALPYAFAQVLIELPHIFLQTVIYGLIVYSCISFDWTMVKFLWYLFFVFMTFMYFTFYGMMDVAMTPNSDIATIVSIAFYAIRNIFAGYLIPRPRIHVWRRWYSWACPVAWTLYGLVASQFGDYTNTIETGETVQEFLWRYFGFRHDFLGGIAAAMTFFTVLFDFVFTFFIKVFNF